MSLHDKAMVTKCGIAETVMFNVGGKLHQTSRSLIMEYQNGDTMLARLISDTWSKKDPADDDVGGDAAIFIDRDGERFRYVLDFMRYGRLVLPYNVSKDLLLLDLDFYGIHHRRLLGDETNSSNKNKDEHNEEIIRYGNEPMGQRLACTLKGQLQTLNNQRTKICHEINHVEKKLFLVHYASALFQHFIKKSSKAVDGVLKILFAELLHLVDTTGDEEHGFDTELSNQVIYKLMDRESEEYQFLQTCLELYGLRLKVIVRVIEQFTLETLQNPSS